MSTVSFLDKIVLVPILQKAYMRYIRVQAHNAETNASPNQLKSKVYLNLLKLQELNLQELVKLRKELIDNDCEEYLKDLEIKVVTTDIKNGKEVIGKTLTVAAFEPGDLAKANKQSASRVNALLGRLRG